MSEKNYTEPEPKRFHGIENDWELVVGMEVHAQVVSQSKLFSGSSTSEFLTVFGITARTWEDW